MVWWGVMVSDDGGIVGIAYDKAKHMGHGVLMGVYTPAAAYLGGGLGLRVGHGGEAAPLEGHQPVEPMHIEWKGEA